MDHLGVMPDAVEVEVARDLSTAWATPAKEAELRAFEEELKTRAEDLDARERRIEERERQLRAQQAPESAAKADGEAAEKARNDAVRVERSFWSNIIVALSNQQVPSGAG